MKRLIVAALTILLSGAACYADDTNFYVPPVPSSSLPAYLGIPAVPSGTGEQYDNTLVSAGLTSCGDIGISTSISGIMGQITSIYKNVPALAMAGTMGLMAYALPTEYSVVSNTAGMIQKYLAILSDRCRVFQESQKFLEKKDYLGIRQAGRARCMQLNHASMGDTAETFCSDPNNQWASLFGAGAGSCVSVMDTSLSNISTYPQGLDKDTLKSWFGDAKVCVTGMNSAVPKSLQMDKAYSTLRAYYAKKVNAIVSQAVLAPLQQSDVSAAGICIGTAVPGMSQGQPQYSGGICPDATVISKISHMGASHQRLFKSKLVDILAMLQLDYFSRQASYLANSAARNNQQMYGLDPAAVNNMVQARTIEFQNFRDSWILAGGQTLQNFQMQVMNEDARLAQGYQDAQRTYSNAMGGTNAPQDATTVMNTLLDAYKTK